LRWLALGLFRFRPNQNLDIIGRIKQFFFPRLPKVGEVWGDKYDPTYLFRMKIIDVDPDGEWVSYAFMFGTHEAGRVYTTSMRGFLSINEVKE
jgi:hypothetical protein